MVQIKQSIYDYLKSKKLPEDSKEVIIPVDSNISMFKLESHGPSAVLSGVMEFRDESDFTNLAVVKQSDLETYSTIEGSGIYMTEVSSFWAVKIFFDGDPKDLIYAFIW